MRLFAHSVSDAGSQISVGANNQGSRNPALEQAFDNAPTERVERSCLVSLTAVLNVDLRHTVGLHVVQRFVDGVASKT